MIEIKTKCCGAVIATGDCSMDALSEAVRAGGYLNEADLSHILWDGVGRSLIFDLIVRKADVPEEVIQAYHDGILSWWNRSDG